MVELDAVVELVGVDTVDLCWVWVIVAIDGGAVEMELRREDGVEETLSEGLNTHQGGERRPELPHLFNGVDHCRERK